MYESWAECASRELKEETGASDCGAVVMVKEHVS